MATDEAQDEVPPVQHGGVTIGDRVAAFVMLDAMGDATQAERTLRLSLVGFSPVEIAAMLQTSVPTVRQNLYTERKKARRVTRSTRGSSK